MPVGLPRPGDRQLTGSNGVNIVVDRESHRAGLQQADFDSFRLNKELQHLGHQLPNVTYALTELGKRKPALAMQVRKSGKSAQARKRYRLTDAGIKSVEEMMNGARA